MNYKSLLVVLLCLVPMLSVAAASDAEILKTASVPYQRVTPKFTEDFLSWCSRRRYVDHQIETQFTQSLQQQVNQALKPLENEKLSSIWQQLIKVLPKALTRQHQPQLHVIKNAAIECSSFASFQILIGDHLSTYDDAHLAFLIAQQLGHNALLHCQRAISIHELTRLKPTSKLHKHFPFLKLHMHNPLQCFQYDQWIIEEADRFALQLCMLAGYAPDKCLDIFRHKHDKLSNNDQRLANAQRFQSLYSFLNGQVPNRIYGLRFYNGLELVAAVHKQEKPPLIILHGIASSADKFLGTATQLDQELAQAFAIYVFNYPNDQSIYQCAQFLKGELDRLGIQTQDAHFVCHSAGGLVCRSLLEMHKLRAKSVSFIGTPHGGSDLGELQEFLECIEFLKLSTKGFKHARTAIIQDGREFMANDLMPNSVFIHLLNSHANNAQSPYALFYGKAMSTPAAMAINKAFHVAKDKIINRLDQSKPLYPAHKRFLTSLIIPQEVLNGDIAVTCPHAQIPRVRQSKQYKLKHWELPRDDNVLRDVAAFIKQHHH